MIRSILLSVMLAFSAFAVQASSYSFSYLSSALGGDSFPLYTVLGELEVADTQNALGSYDILGISGGVSGPGGGSITGLVNNPNQPYNKIDYGLGFYWNNNYPLDDGGVLFYGGAEDAVFNIFMENGVATLLSHNANGPVGAISSVGTFSVTPMSAMPVPEPETYAMMLAGLGMLGLASRRRRQQHLPSLPAMA